MLQIARNTRNLIGTRFDRVPRFIDPDHTVHQWQTRSKRIPTTYSTSRSFHVLPHRFFSNSWSQWASSRPKDDIFQRNRVYLPGGIEKRTMRLYHKRTLSPCTTSCHNGVRSGNGFHPLPWPNQHLVRLQEGIDPTGKLYV